MESIKREGIREWRNIADNQGRIYTQFELSEKEPEIQLKIKTIKHSKGSYQKRAITMRRYLASKVT